MSDTEEYSLFVGCIASNRYPAIERATEQVLEHLSVRYTHMKGTSCCPPPGVIRSFDET
ncbi:MAG: heterodisulfide reductase-related iron-sulfur binding cluster, partial [Methermicoccaceae archaeon]